jgi:hypothetical protein
MPLGAPATGPPLWSFRGRGSGRSLGRNATKATRCAPNLCTEVIATLCTAGLRWEGEVLLSSVSTLDSRHPSMVTRMRSRERILANLEAIYRESYERAKGVPDEGRMIELDSGYMRDQLMLEILLDIRDLFSVAPAASGGTALEKLEAIRRLTKLR